jgi:hypothetical protein
VPNNGDTLLLQLYTFSTVEEFWQLFNNLLSIEDKIGCSYHLFQVRRSYTDQPRWLAPYHAVFDNT